MGKKIKNEIYFMTAKIGATTRAGSPVSAVVRRAAGQRLPGPRAAAAAALLARGAA